MPGLLNIEESDSTLPILCVFGDSPLLTQRLAEEGSGKFRIIIISNKRPSFLDTYPEIYFISYDKVQLLPKLNETIRYAVIFLKEHNVTSAHSFLEKLTVDKTKTLLVVGVDETNRLQHHITRLRALPTLRTAFLGELMTRKKTEEKGNLSKIIENVILNHTIRVNGEEVIPVYGITIKDTMLGIGRLLFGNFRTDTIYYLFYKHPQTILETSRLLTRVDPDIQMLFVEEKMESTLPTREHLKTLIHDKLQMNDSYIDTSLGGFEKGVTEVFNEEAEIETIQKKKHRRKIFRKVEDINFPAKLGVITIASGMFLFLFINLLFFGVGLFLLRESINHLQSNNFQRAQQEAVLSRYFLSSVKPTISLTFDAIGIIDKGGALRQKYLIVERGRELAELAGKTVNSLANGKEITEETLTSSFANLSFLFQESQRITLATDNKTLSEQLKNNYAKMLSFSEVLASIAGFDEEKDYLLLFQNNEELRPNGGFIGSIGELTIKNGKIESIAIQDVYELDGQLKNHIEPPFIVRRNLQPHLYLRDSNFNLNFQETASTAAKIYNLETGKEPDGVVAVNLKVLQKILEITGPITLPTYNVTVTKDTVSQFLHSTIHENFFPGSTQKKDVLNSVFTILLEKSKTDPDFNIALLKLLPELLEQKDIQVSFRDTSIQKIFSSNGYAGEFKDMRKADSQKIHDFIYINEANIGVNKVNAAVSREVMYEAIIGQGKLTSIASLVLTNNSPTDNYTSYIQVAVPRGSILKKITVNGVAQRITPSIVDPQVYEAPNFQKPEGLEVEQYIKEGNSYFAFIVIAQLGKKTTIDIEYDNGITKSLSTIIDYSLLFIKQPGTHSYKVTTIVDYPEGYVPVQTKADTYGKNFLTVAATIDRDYLINIKLQKKK